MLYLTATLHTLGATLASRARTKLTERTDRGSETIEKVLWGIAVIAIVGIAVAVIRNYVTTESAKIK